MKKIALLSLADIDNYGDIFFPYMMKKELENRMEDVEIDIVTNVEKDNVLYKTIQYNKELIEKYDAAIYTGGDIILPAFTREIKSGYGDSYTGNPEDIVYDWLDIPNVFKAWFGVGINVNIKNEKLLKEGRKKLDFLSVRGLLSKKVIEDKLYDNDLDMRICPDLGWLFTKYIDEEYLPAKRIFQNYGLDKPYMVCQMYEAEIKDLVRIVQELCDFKHRFGVNIVVIPITRTEGEWNEREVMMREKVKKLSKGEIICITESMDFMVTANILRSAKFFVGESMHAAVTLMAYGKPVVNIRSPYNIKLQELHGSRCRATCFVPGWTELTGILTRLNNESNNEKDGKYANMYAEYMRYRLSKEIDGLVNRILEK